MNKVWANAAEAVRDVVSGSSIAVGGFGICGVPFELIAAVGTTNATDLWIVSNNCGLEGLGLGVLLDEGRISRITASYVGENAEFARQYFHGELEVELTPQGTLAERMRAGGVGIPAFFTASGVGSQVAEGGVPLRYHQDGTVAVASPPKETREFNGRTYVLEESIITDFALVHAAVADTVGNLVFHESARNFNPLCAMAARLTIVEAEEIVDPGEIDPDAVHLPGIFVQRVVKVASESIKPIERLTVRPKDEVA